jgi:SAM-dependent methyltransferase
MKKQKAGRKGSGRRFRPWELQWKPVHIERFWDWWGSNPALTHMYFSKQVGDAVLDEAARHIPLRGTVVDVGCGPGHMVEKLLSRGISTMALDTSPASVSLLNKRFKGHEKFLGARVNAPGKLPLKDSSADIVLLIESVEHMDDQYLRGTLSEVKRIAKPGGCVIVTTPNQENLTEHKTVCPSCGCVFHTVQHMRAFSAETLGRLMQDAGFAKVVCSPMLFLSGGGPLSYLHRLQHSMRGKTLPHLMYIGKNDK